MKSLSATRARGSWIISGISTITFVADHDWESGDYVANKLINVTAQENGTNGVDIVI